MNKEKETIIDFVAQEIEKLSRIWDTLAYDDRRRIAKEMVGKDNVQNFMTNMDKYSKSK